MAFIDYKRNTPSYWLNSYVDDRRITVGQYTYFDEQITFGLWQPEDKIEIGKFCSLAKNITIFGGGEHFTTRTSAFPFVLMFAEDRPEQLIDARNKGATIIKNDVWIGLGATIMSGIKIGNGAVIGAKAVVASDVPDYAIAVGNPARVIRHRFLPETIERLLKINWWNWELSKILNNLDLIYQNPDNWSENIQFRESKTEDAASISTQQLKNWEII